MVLLALKVLPDIRAGPLYSLASKPSDPCWPGVTPALGAPCSVHDAQPAGPPRALLLGPDLSGQASCPCSRPQPADPGLQLLWLPAPPLASWPWPFRSGRDRIWAPGPFLPRPCSGSGGAPGLAGFPEPHLGRGPWPRRGPCGLPGLQVLQLHLKVLALLRLLVQGPLQFARLVVGLVQLRGEQGPEPRGHGGQGQPGQTLLPSTVGPCLLLRPGLRCCHSCALPNPLILQCPQPLVHPPVPSACMECPLPSLWKT